MSTNKILNAACRNPHMTARYIAFVEHLRKERLLPAVIHRHHILPKAKDMFPQYKGFDEHPWNELRVSPREHFLLHWMLAKIFPGSSQGRAFYYMVNKLGCKKSRDYDKAKTTHIQYMRDVLYTEERNRKISKALAGVPKSEEHREKLQGHLVTQETRDKIRSALLGSTHSSESKLKMSSARLGRKKAPHSDIGRGNISKAKIQAGMKWYNNGDISRMLGSPEPGWAAGRLPWRKATTVSG